MPAIGLNRKPGVWHILREYVNTIVGTTPVLKSKKEGFNGNGTIRSASTPEGESCTGSVIRIPRGILSQTLLIRLHILRFEKQCTYVRRTTYPNPQNRKILHFNFGNYAASK